MATAEPRYISTRSHWQGRKSLSAVHVLELEDALMQMLGTSLRDSKVVIEMSRGIEAVPLSIMRICVREILTSGVDCLKFYTSIRSLTRVSTYVFEQSGELLTDDECRLWEAAKKGDLFWSIGDVLSRSEIEEIERCTAHYRNRPIVQAHYAERRKKANAALASKSLRQQVFDRHGEACLKCGDTSDLAIDHIVPVALGGTDELDNLQVLCRSCNSSKGSSLDTQHTGSEPQ